MKLEAGNWKLEARSSRLEFLIRLISIFGAALSTFCLFDPAFQVLLQNLFL